VFALIAKFRRHAGLIITRGRVTATALAGPSRLRWHLGRE
jgi:hypothetical protein